MNWFQRLCEFLKDREPEYKFDALNELRRKQMYYKAKYLQVKAEADKLDKELKDDLPR